jgi:hypothetical protein
MERERRSSAYPSSREDVDRTCGGSDVATRVCWCRDRARRSHRNVMVLTFVRDVVHHLIDAGIAFSAVIRISCRHVARLRYGKGANAMLS